MALLITEGITSLRFPKNKYFVEWFINYKVQTGKNVHPVYGTGIGTHDLKNVSLLP